MQTFYLTKDGRVLTNYHSALKSGEYLEFIIKEDNIIYVYNKGKEIYHVDNAINLLFRIFRNLKFLSESDQNLENFFKTTILSSDQYKADNKLNILSLANEIDKLNIKDIDVALLDLAIYGINILYDNDNTGSMAVFKNFKNEGLDLEIDVSSNYILNLMNFYEDDEFDCVKYWSFIDTNNNPIAKLITYRRSDSPYPLKIKIRIGCSYNKMSGEYIDLTVNKDERILKFDFGNCTDSPILGFKKELSLSDLVEMNICFSRFIAKIIEESDLEVERRGLKW